eukprot:5694640-Pyramimonas_sp.AAC.1
MEAAVAVIDSIEGPCIVAGGWNMSPDEVEGSGFCSVASITLVATQLFTCRGGTGSSVIDYFGLGDACMRAYSKCRLIYYGRSNPIVLYNCAI